MKINIDAEQHYVWVAVDSETFEVLAVEVSPGRSSLDALLFLKDVSSNDAAVARCCGPTAARGTIGHLSG